MDWRILSAAIVLMAAASDSGATGPATSIRPAERSGDIDSRVKTKQTATQAGLEQWVEKFRPRAQAKGITDATFEVAMRGVQYDAGVIKRDRNQAEFTKTIWDYLDTAVSDLRIANGRKALAKWDDTLSKINKRFGVEKEVIVAIWGLESAYGTFRGSEPVINGLTTLAYDARRAEFFEDELIHALHILQNADTTAARMRGSWAGAMGHTQFMPSSFQAHAVDFDQDGRRNIWEDNPRDALASTGAYLRHFGWVEGQPWGVEINLPETFDYTLADRDDTRLPSEWANLGIAPVNGAFDDAHGVGSILLPGGSEGAAFMVFSNFAVIEKYNTADAYVIGVGHLSDRIVGAAAFEHEWPRRLRALSKPERIELQERLTAAGFDTVKIDAKMGPLTINAVRQFQKAKGLVPDGFPSLDVLERLRAL
ncbi:Peptidoglycan binding domain protein [Sulfitobacter noctilucicola]|uniref:Lytic murein transglycosylase n=1 Tax=Sulfitobacter noctilucicola TaxID=1342301 RepID=A0A7W6Q1W5_9RHOB|nr:lytic murein transglycosylase [Sulfitobacter noctilucicola]KIN62998.1 Peptidoglycan binding domain protein [Sulfitobacter noctilucicola]MBB4172475.1 lytic murein transglycosylase [Sulfitobacter noctilucicola]